MKKVWKKATVLMLCGTILTTSVVYNYQTEDKNAKTANHVAKNDEKENKGQKSKWKSKTKSDDEVKLLNANVSYNADSDGDGMTDAFETLNNMNPNVADSDGNGISDGKDTYTITYTSQDEMTEDEAYLPSVEMTATGEQLQTLAIGAVDDNPLLCDKIPGYIGHAYNFTMDGEFEQATLKFEVDDSVDMKKEPTVYYYNEETQELEELKTTVKGHMVSAVTTHFSKYILVYKQDFNNFENVDISNTNTFLDLACKNKLPIGLTMLVSPQIAYENKNQNAPKEYGDITSNKPYNRGHYDSIEKFLAKYTSDEFIESIFIEYEELYGTHKVGIPNDEQTDFKRVTREGYYSKMAGFHGGLRGDEWREIWKNWQILCAHGSDSYIGDYNHYSINAEIGEQLKFDDMYITNKWNHFGVKDNWNRLKNRITDLKEYENSRKAKSVPVCNNIIYVIGEVADSAVDIQDIFEEARDEEMSVYLICLGTGKRKEDVYKEAVNEFKSYEENAKNINVRYYYAKDTEEFDSILNNQLMDDIIEDYEKKDTDNDGLSDIHEYLISEGVIKTGTKVPVRDVLDELKLSDVFTLKEEDEVTDEGTKDESVECERLNWNNEDTDEDMLKDGEEIEIKEVEFEDNEEKKHERVYKGIIHSDPLRKDTDGDGYDDHEEMKLYHRNPLRYDITDVTLSYAAYLSYCNFKEKNVVGKKVREVVKTKRDALKRYSGEEVERYAYQSLNEFEIIDCEDGCEEASYGLGMVILKKKINGKDNYIVATRGLEGNNQKDLNAAIGAVLGLDEDENKGLYYQQLDVALKILKKYSNSNSNSNWFVTGQSLGGRIAQDIYVHSNIDFKSGAVFNSLGYLKDSYSTIQNNIKKDPHHYDDIEIKFLDEMAPGVGDQSFKIIQYLIEGIDAAYGHRNTARALDNMGKAWERVKSKENDENFRFYYYDTEIVSGTFAASSLFGSIGTKISLKGDKEWEIQSKKRINDQRLDSWDILGHSKIAFDYCKHILEHYFGNAFIYHAISFISQDSTIRNNNGTKVLNKE